MLSNLLMMKSIVSTEVEWKDFSALSKDAREKIVDSEDNVEFVKAKQYNDHWVKLDLKAIDVVESKFLLLINDEVITHDGSNAMNMITNASEEGLLNFFESSEKINEWINGNEEVRKTVIDDARKEAERFNLPVVLNNALTAVLNSEWNTNEIKEFLKNTNINLDVFCVFPEVPEETFEVQCQYFFKMSSGKMRVTNVLKIKKENGEIFKECFEDENELDVMMPCVDVVATPVEVERPEEEKQPEKNDENETEALVTEGEGNRAGVVVETENLTQEQTVEEGTAAEQDTVEENQEVTTNEKINVVKNNETTDADAEKKGLSGWIVAIIVIACVSIGILAVAFIWRNVTKSNKVQ